MMITMILQPAVAAVAVAAAATRQKNGNRIEVEEDREPSIRPSMFVKRKP